MMTTTSSVPAAATKVVAPGLRSPLRRELAKHLGLYLMFVPALVYFTLFHYLPMAGLVIVFQNYDPMSGLPGMLASPNWIGMRNFTDFFSSFYFWRLIRNTLVISGLKLVVGFPFPILLALALNEVRSKRYRSMVQTITSLPNFLSWVIIGGIVFSIVSLDGPVNKIVSLTGRTPVNFLGHVPSFRSILVISHVWQSAGWGSIIYLAGLSSINPELYQSATVDGASRLQQMWHISLPSIAHLIAILLIMSVGNILNAGFEQVLVLYNPSVYEGADIIDTFIYREGLQNLRFSYSAAVGVFKNLVGLLFIFGANRAAKRLGHSGLF